MQRLFTTYAVTIECATNQQVKTWLEINSTLFTKTFDPNVVVLDMGPNSHFDQDEKQNYLNEMKNCINETMQLMPTPFQVVRAGAHAGRGGINNVLVLELKDEEGIIKSMHEALKKKYNITPRFDFKLFVTLGYTTTAISEKLLQDASQYFIESGLRIIPRGFRITRRRNPQDESHFELLQVAPSLSLLHQPLSPSSSSSLPSTFLLMLTCEISKEIDVFLAKHANQFSDSILNPDSSLLYPHSTPHISLLDAGSNSILADKQNDPSFRNAIYELFLKFNLLAQPFEIHQSRRFGRVGTKGEGKILVLELKQQNNLIGKIHSALKKMIEQITENEIKEDFQFIPHVTIGYTKEVISETLLQQLDTHIAENKPLVKPLSFALCRRDGFGQYAKFSSAVLAGSQNMPSDLKERKSVSPTKLNPQRLFSASPKDTNRYVLTLQCSLSEKLKKWIRDNKKFVSPFRPLFDDLSAPIYLRLMAVGGNITEAAQNATFKKKFQKIVKYGLMHALIDVYRLSATGHDRAQITLNLVDKNNEIMEFLEKIEKLLLQHGMNGFLIPSKFDFVLGIPTPRMVVTYYDDDSDEYRYKKIYRTKDECEEIVAELNHELTDHWDGLHLIATSCQINRLDEMTVVPEPIVKFDLPAPMQVDIPSVTYTK